MSYCMLVFGAMLSEREFRRGFPVPFQPIGKWIVQGNRRRLNARLRRETRVSPDDIVG